MSFNSAGSYVGDDHVGDDKRPWNCACGAVCPEYHGDCYACGKVRPLCTTCGRKYQRFGTLCNDCDLVHVNGTTGLTAIKARAAQQAPLTEPLHACRACGKPFKAVIPEQRTCAACLARAESSMLPEFSLIVLERGKGRAGKWEGFISKLFRLTWFAIDAAPGAELAQFSFGSERQLKLALPCSMFRTKLDLHKAMKTLASDETTRPWLSMALHGSTSGPVAITPVPLLEPGIALTAETNGDVNAIVAFGRVHK